MKFIYTLLILLPAFHFNAQTILDKSLDTLWVEVDQSEVAFISVRTQPGTTLYSLGKGFGLDITQLIAFNNDLKIDELEIGDPIKIPFDALRTSINFTTDKQTSYRLCYRVKPKDNLFRISRIYLGIKKKELMEMNNMNHNSLNIDQVLTVGYLLDFSEPAISVSSDSSIIARSDSLLIDNQGKILRTPMDEYRENDIPISTGKGVAFWDKTAEESKRYYVLHPSAKLHSLIEIINPMNERRVLAKVVGNIPQNAYTSDIQLVVSSAVAKKLGVLDSRFFATYQYIQ